ncbi:MFS transporter [Halomarina pelagica]|uniref:MFS transporter n=1 Tax=Halomarina pelagica TaxID=2961599 RepID=UPI0020C58C55|nr:MFS transporter [Halomarina sp. BND7]
MTGSGPPDWRSWTCLAGTWALSLFANAYLIVPASVLPRIMETLDLGPETAIWIVSAAFGAWAATNFLLGFVIDRVGDVRVAAAGTAALLLAGVWGFRAGTAGDFGGLLASRALGGVALAAIWTTGANLVGRAFPTESQGTALGLFTASAPAGIAIGQSAGPLVGNAYGWPANLLAFPLLAAAAFPVFLLAMGATSLAPRTATDSLLDDLDTVLASPAVRFGCAMSFVGYSLFLFFNGWMPTYLTEEFAVPLSIGSLLVALFPAVGIVSRSTGGLLSDRLLGRRRLPVIRLSFAVSLPIVAAIAVTNTVALLVVLLVVAGFAIQLSIGVFYSYVRESVPAGVAGTALSFLGSTAVAGAFTAPVVAGVLIDWTGAYLAAFAYAAALAALGVLLAWRASEPTTPA